MSKDEFIQYPLEFDKEHYKNDELMNWVFGGKQLLEILEKDINLEMIEKNRIEYDIPPHQIERLKSWLKFNGDISKVQDELNLATRRLVTSFFLKGAGILSVLYEHVDLTPVVRDNEFISRFTFIDYDTIKFENYSLIVSKINNNHWSNPTRPLQHEVERMTRFYCYDHNTNEFVEGTILDDLKSMYLVSNKLLEVKDDEKNR